MEELELKISSEEE